MPLMLQRIRDVLRLSFTKRSGKFDDLLIERPDGSKEAIKSPKQGIIPHDMVHYAVEKIILREGFLSKLAAGEKTQSIMAGEAEAEAIERLVETVQAELWSGRVSIGELVAVYRHACAARAHECFAVSEDEIRLIRGEIDDLTARWQAVPVNGVLALEMPTRSK